MKICVTKNDIKLANEKCNKDFLDNQNHCPISQSFKRKGYKEVRSGYNIINADGERYLVPPAARSFMINFDSSYLGRRLKPQVFTLEKVRG